MVNQPLFLMTPTEAFDPNRDGGLDSLGPEPEEMDELSEPEPEEMGAAESGADSLAGEEAIGTKTPMEAMSPKEKKELEKIKEMIKKGKLKDKKLDEALEKVGFNMKDIEKLQNIKAKGIHKIV